MTTWAPVISAVAAVIAAAIALFGVLLTQKRADERAQRELGIRQAEEEAKRKREDALRSYDQRRDAYSGFFTEFERRVRLFEAWQAGEFGQTEPPEDALTPLAEKLTMVNIYGTVTARAAADRLFRWLAAEMWRPVHPQEDVERLERVYISAVRQDLGVTDRVEQS
ncbi:hypothetical protein [Nocardia xishanensis]|uniref:DUF4760 domain-containing protein n=1 Tax=Nocardia xishanensis TaxID=238964 RepID=A0ABW7WX81_9NOCA